MGILVRGKLPPGAKGGWTPLVLGAQLKICRLNRGPQAKSSGS